MAEFTMTSMPFVGHVNPLEPIARTLVARGHTVRWYTGERFRSVVTGTGAAFVPMDASVDRDFEALEAAHPGPASKGGLAYFRWRFINLFVDPIPAQVAGLREVLAAHPADVVVSDLMFMGAGFLHELGGPSYATVGVFPWAMPSRDTAPFGAALPPNSTAIGRVRNRALNLLFDRVLMREVARRFRTVRAQLGLPAADGPQLASPLLHLQSGVAEFEYPRSDLPPQVHFVGALVAGGSDAPLPDWWPEIESTTLPVVHVTQGTLSDKQLDDLVLPTLRVLADDDVLVVATVGDHDPAGLGALPANARVAPFITHDRLLPRTAAMVTNGGFGGVQTALRHGVPLVVAGDTDDKPEVAARVAWSGAGVNLKTGRPTAPRLRAALDAVLHDPRYRRDARRLMSAYRRLDAPTRCAELLERLAETRRPVLTGPGWPVAQPPSSSR